MRKKILIISVVLIACFGLYKGYEFYTYKASIAKFKSEIAKNFIDPDSVKFRDIVLSEDIKEIKKYIPFYKRVLFIENRHILCGQVNAKNSYGAYVGYKTFYIFYDYFHNSYTSSMPRLDGNEDLAEGFCNGFTSVYRE